MPQIAAPIKAKGGARRWAASRRARHPPAFSRENFSQPAARSWQAGQTPQPYPQSKRLPRSPEITGVRLFHDQARQAFAAKLLGEAPGGGLIEPHQRREDRERPVHAQRKRGLGGANRRVAAIGIAGVIGFAHAADQRGDPAPVSQSGGEGQEQNIAPGHEGVGQAGGAKGDLGLPGQRRLRDFAQRGDGYGVIVAKTSAPRRRHFRQPRAQNRPLAEFDHVALAIVEADRLDAREARQCVGEAGGRSPVRRRTAPARSRREGWTWNVAHGLAGLKG